MRIPSWMRLGAAVFFVTTAAAADPAGIQFDTDLHVPDLHLRTPGDDGHEVSEHRLQQLRATARRIAPGHVGVVAVTGDVYEGDDREREHHAQGLARAGTVLKDVSHDLRATVVGVEGDHDLFSDLYREHIDADHHPGMPRTIMRNGEGLVTVPLRDPKRPAQDQFGLSEAALAQIDEQLGRVVAAGKRPTTQMHTMGQTVVPHDVKQQLFANQGHGIASPGNEGAMSEGAKALHAIMARHGVVHVTTGHLWTEGVSAQQGGWVNSQLPSHLALPNGNDPGFGLNTRQHGVEIDGQVVPIVAVSTKLVPYAAKGPPIVQITYPMDRNLITGGEQLVHGKTRIYASVADRDPPKYVVARIGESDWIRMSEIPGQRGRYQSPPFDSNLLADGGHQVEVRAKNRHGVGGNRVTTLVLNHPVRQDQVDMSTVRRYAHAVGAGPTALAWGPHQQIQVNGAPTGFEVLGGGHVDGHIKTIPQRGRLIAWGREPRKSRLPKLQLPVRLLSATRIPTIK